MLENLIYLIPICIVAYFIGNINIAILTTRKSRDIRKEASGNPGASNMLRTFGFKRAIVVFLFDVSKGVLPVLIAGLLYGLNAESGRIAMYAAGLSVVLGHCFPVLFRFKGGKGVATMVGVFLVINPLLALAAFGIGLLYVFIFDYAAVSSLLFINIVVLWQLFHDSHIVIHGMLLGFYFLVMFTHRTNIARILMGQENKAGLLKKLKKKK